MGSLDGKMRSVITQQATRSSGYWTDILISIKCLEGTNETEYIMSLAARANEIQHRSWKLQYYNKKWLSWKFHGTPTLKQKWN